MEAEEDEEDGGEEVAEWGEEFLGGVGEGAGEGDADEEGADGGGDLELLGDSGDQEGEAEDFEEEDFFAGAGDEAFDEGAVAECDVEDDRDGDGGDGEGGGAADEAGSRRGVR